MEKIKKIKEKTMKAKKLLAMVLALVTALAVIPVTASATAVKPISSADQLVELMSTPEMWNGAYYLTADIDLTGKTQSPIGSAEEHFTGYFDGMGHSITGLNLSGEKHQGLFGWVHNAEIKNFSVSGTVTASTTSSRGNGGVVGVVSGNTLIENVTASVSVTSGAQAVGGLAGYVFPYSTGTVNIVNCHSDGTAKGTFGVGGLIGILTAGRETNTTNPVTDGTVNVIGCSASGTVNYVSATGNYYAQSGGLIGQILYFNSDDFVINVVDCTNSAKVLSASADGADKGRVGGIVGWISSGNTSIKVVENNGAINIVSCSNTVDLNARAGLGGIVGVASINDSASYELNVVGCTNTGTMSTTAGGYDSGIVGWIEGGDVTITACKNSGNVVATKTSSNSFAGGILGYASLVSGAAGLTLEVSNSANYGAVSGTGYYVGGVVGTLQDGVHTVSNCANYGNVTADRAVGGIIGWAQRATANSKWKITLCNSFNAGTIYGPTKLIGSIIGYPHASFPLTASDCYYLAGSAKQGSTVQNAVGHGTAGSVTTDAAGYNSMTSGFIAAGVVTPMLNGEPSSGAWEQGTTYPELTALKNTAEAKVETGIYGISLSVGTDLSFNAIATLAEGVDPASTKVVFTYADETYEAEAVENGLMYKYTLKAIAPQSMTELITVDLYVDDVLVDSARQSVRGYCENLIDAESASDAVKQLAKDILAYGAAAQEYRSFNLDSLANVDISGISDFEELDNSVYAASSVAGTAVDGVKFNSVGVRFDYTNRVFFTFTAPSADGITVIVNGNEAEITPYGSSYIVYSDDISATDYNDNVVAVLKAGDTVVQTVTYSVASFIYEMQNDMDGEELSGAAKLARALYNYGCSAVAAAAE